MSYKLPPLVPNDTDRDELLIEVTYLILFFDSRFMRINLFVIIDETYSLSHLILNIRNSKKLSTKVAMQQTRGLPHIREFRISKTSTYSAMST